MLAPRVVRPVSPADGATLASHTGGQPDLGRDHPSTRRTDADPVSISDRHRRGNDGEFLEAVVSLRLLGAQLKFNVAAMRGLQLRHDFDHLCGKYVNI